jgi:hypothetical protein
MSSANADTMATMREKTQLLLHKCEGPFAIEVPPFAVNNTQLAIDRLINDLSATLELKARAMTLMQAGPTPPAIDNRRLDLALEISGNTQQVAVVIAQYFSLCPNGNSK